MYCYKCGAKNPDEAVYCMKCGTKLLNISQTTSTTNHHKQEDAGKRNTIVDQLKMQKPATTVSKYRDFVNEIVRTVGGYCVKTLSRRVAGYYYFEPTYDKDIRSITDQANDEFTHLELHLGRYEALRNGNIEEIKNEIKEELINEGFLVNAVEISKHSKTKSIEMGQGIFGKKYKKVLVDYAQVYIDVQW